jgi:metal-responsive CopG/Arc/MetJ family transcriptional regulator
MKFESEITPQNALVAFVMDRCNDWRNYRDENYMDRWDEYERLWRGLYADEDKTRDSERSRLISPALQQAVDNKQADLEEAVFAKGVFFDISDDINDQDKTDVEKMKSLLSEDFKKDRVRKQIGQVMTLAEIYGTGIGELIVKQKKNLAPATQPTAQPGLNMIGVNTSYRVSVDLKPINPRNFLIDPNATTIDDAMGCAIEEYVGRHAVIKGMEDGVYKKIAIGDASLDTDLEPNQDLTYYQTDKVLLLRYYGLVPKKLLVNPDDTSFEDDELYSEMVEALIVIANGEDLLKAEETPFMMQDRPVVAYQADSVPGRFWGRGTAEKAYNMQKAVDAQIRSHVDSLGLTAAPMMAIDASRLPRGQKFEIKPGKNILVNGNPQEILQPFKFGVTDKANIETAQIFERMMLQATGTLDTANLPAQVSGGDAAAAGLAMAVSGIIKKNKRSLVNFQEDFLIPFVQKAAWRYMQFAPDRYPVKDFEFIPTGTLGMVAREFEQAQMMAMMSTLGPNSPIVPLLLQGIVEYSSLPNRESLLQQLQQLTQPNPEQQQAQQQATQLQLADAQATVQEKQARAQKAAAEAQKASIEAQLMPEEVRAKIVNAATQNLPNNDDTAEREFQRRIKIAELMLKEEDIKSNENIAKMQMETKKQVDKQFNDALGE